MTFDQWYKELKELGDKKQFPVSTDQDAFRESYDDGLSPEDALWEEVHSAN